MRQQRFNTQLLPMKLSKFSLRLWANAKKNSRGVEHLPNPNHSRSAWGKLPKLPCLAEPNVVASVLCLRLIVKTTYVFHPSSLYIDRQPDALKRMPYLFQSNRMAIYIVNLDYLLRVVYLVYLVYLAYLVYLRPSIDDFALQVVEQLPLGITLDSLGELCFKELRQEPYIGNLFVLLKHLSYDL